MVYFFNQAFTLGQQNIRLVSISELRKKRRYYLKMAKQLRADAAEQERLGLYVDRRMQKRHSLMKNWRTCQRQRLGVRCL
jgi:hypothetical protein